MKLTEVKNDLVKEKYFFTTHESGLKIFIYPKKENNSTYVLFGTRYGSINTRFKTSESDEIIEVPDGIAHYLEHKMFELEEGDAFAQYAKTGASANAYTSFDRTCYLFSCTENFEESLKILLKYVQTPYFTEKTVAKEQGIIGQEIKMYDDDPNWRVFFNMLCALYQKHPVNIDIAGTVESIAKITPEKLYQCYNAFYNPNNMSICIVGNVDENDVLRILEENLKDVKKVETETFFPEEPYEVAKNRVKQKFPIASPMFNLGFKEFRKPLEKVSAKERAETDVLLELVASKSSHLYRKLLDEGLINTASFEYDYNTGTGYSCVVLSGESKDPDRVAEIIKAELDLKRKQGITVEEFERSKKSAYGRALSFFNSSDNIANLIIDLDFADDELFNYVNCLAKVELDDIKNRLNNYLDCSNCALSIVSPAEGK